MSTERQPGPWPETLTAQVAALRGAHESCQLQRDERTAEDRAWRASTDAKLDRILEAHNRIPWKVLLGNGVAPIDVRVDRLERWKAFMTRVGWALAGGAGALVAALVVKAIEKGGTP